MADHPYQDIRLNYITSFMTKMTDIKIRRHPFRHLVVLGLCDVDKDLYGDTKSTLSQKIEKEVILIKNVDLDYVNALTGVLMEDGEALPWVMVLTLTSLPRTLHQGDMMEDEGTQYKVSAVRPVNRQNPNIIECFVHPYREFELVDLSPEIENDYSKLM